MPKRILPLTDIQVKNAKAEGKAVKLFDGGGLFLLVEPSGVRGWRFKYRFNGKGKQLSLGVYPNISLAGAREKRENARKLLEKGIDPSSFRKAKKRDREVRQANTFMVLAEEWLEAQSTLAETTREMTRRRLELDVFPALGGTPVADITPKIILMGVLRPMERRGVVELAHRTRSIISRILRYGVACGTLERDVSADLRGALQSFERKHMAAPTEPNKVAAILRAIDGYGGSVIVKAALQLHPLVVTRPGELRHLEWKEIDFEGGRWSIPGGKMKMGQPHIVPLSKQAAKILADLHPLTGCGRYVFPSARSTARPISDCTLNAALRRLDIGKDEMTSHGWRAVFRTLADEILQERVDLLEQQLAHRVADSLGRAYNRTQFLSERCAMMQRWANYLDGLKAGAKVIPFRQHTTN
jgi:integrase